MNNGSRFAKPQHISMSPADWNQLTSCEQQALIAARPKSNTIAPTSPTPIERTPPVIKSAKARALMESMDREDDYFALQRKWVKLNICKCPPTKENFELWFFNHTFDAVLYAFHATATSISKEKDRNPEWLLTHDAKISYASGAMWRVRERMDAVTITRMFIDGSPAPENWDSMEVGDKIRMIDVYGRKDRKDKKKHDE
jgi:hypothetical protein